MCRTIAHGGRRCDPAPGSPASAAERALTRAEAVAEQASVAFAGEADQALDRLFTAVAEATPEAERTAAVRTWLDALAGAWHRVVRAIERAHARRIEACDARWRDRLGTELSAVREARRVQERAALDRVHAAELHLASEELLSRSPDWGDELWRPCQEADLEDLQHDLAEERLRLHKLETVQARRPTPRAASDIRQTQARVECWRLTLEGQRARLAATPRTKAEALDRVETARAAFEAVRGAGAGPTADDRAYLSHTDLVAEIEHSRHHHPAERRGRPVRT